MDSLGSRFAFYRVDVDERDSQTRRALVHRRGAKEMRDELREAVSALFAGITLPEEDALTRQRPRAARHACRPRHDGTLADRA